MSWTEVFPVLSEEMLTDYRQGRTEEERERYEGWLGVTEIFPAGKNLSASLVDRQSSFANPDGMAACGGNDDLRMTNDNLRSGKSESKARGGSRVNAVGGAREAYGRDAHATAKHVVSATLFWKHVMGVDPDLPKPTRKRLVMAKQMGLVKRFSPWESYVEPLFRYSAEAMKRHPHVEFRLYLASDLDFLIDDLTALGWTIYLMKSPSVRYSPGGFWRFLALADKGKLVTVIDSDRMGEVNGEIARTALMAQLKLGLWRVPGYYGADNGKGNDTVRYRPILGGHFGGKGGLPIQEMIEAFIWHSEHGTLPTMADIPGRGPVPIHRVNWPDYGYDEWFQLAALYPRMVQKGTLTFLPKNTLSALLPLDIEYVTWANRRSEIVFF